MKKIFPVVFAIGIIVLIIFAILGGIDKYEQNKTALINQNPGYAESVIIDKGNHKGAHLEVEYFVEGKRYTHRQGMKAKTIANKNEGDKLIIKYSKTDPSVAIIDL